MTPGLPFVPAIAVMVNIYLIFKLSILTLVRFTVWMAIGTFRTRACAVLCTGSGDILIFISSLVSTGLGVYFYYGIKHSTLEEENIELTVSAEQPAEAAPVPVVTSSPEPRSDLFIPAQNFPTWDD